MLPAILTVCKLIKSPTRRVITPNEMKIIGFLESASPWTLHEVPDSIALLSKFRNKTRDCDDTECRSFAHKDTPRMSSPKETETREWSVDAYDPGSPVEAGRYAGNTRRATLFAKQWRVCSGKSSPLPVHFFPFHLTTRSREMHFVPRTIPRCANKRASRAFLSLRSRQIMIALISVDSRLSVLSRDIVTRQHEGQDNSQKSLSAVGTDENWCRNGRYVTFAAVTDM